MSNENPASTPFDLGSVFEVDDYLFAYADELTDERSRQEVARLVRLLELEQPLKILDLACGFGRHANHLAALGHLVAGMDLIPGFLDLARQQAKEMGVQVTYLQGDMRRLNFQGKFDLVLMLFTSFGYFEDRENEQVLKNITRALKPGGRVMFDTPNRDTFFKDLNPSEAIEKGTDLLINNYSFDPLSGRLHNDRVVVRDGTRREKPYSIRLYNASEILALLGRCGFVDPRILGEDDQPLSPKAKRMTVIASRPQGG